MNGFVGLHPARNWKRGVFALKRRSQNSREECVGLVVGLVARIVKYMKKTTYHLYILKCADGTLYTGITTDLKRRVGEHNSLTLGAKYTHSRRPVKLVYSRSLKDRSKATREEARVKKLTRAEKLLLVSSRA
jgi:putative endonuclease